MSFTTQRRISKAHRPPSPSKCPPPPPPSAPVPHAPTLHAQSLHFDFLSQIKPVYLLRTRAYSRTISKKPFLVNYQGAQFRVYPGEYQCLLDVGSRYKRVSENNANRLCKIRWRISSWRRGRGNKNSCGGEGWVKIESSCSCGGRKRVFI